jgi:hypothetical protein
MPGGGAGNLTLLEANMEAQAAEATQVGAVATAAARRHAESTFGCREEFPEELPATPVTPARTPAGGAGSPAPGKAGDGGPQGLAILAKLASIHA